jgi:uncharacterized cupredoxin-like copper-binding protein
MEFKTHRRALLGALAVVAVSAGVGSQALAASSVKVTVSEFKVSPSPKSHKAGKVTFSVKNSGDDEHELVIIKTSKSASKLPIRAGRASTKGKVAQVTNIDSGKTKKLTVKLKKGHYALICNIPGHYAGGMRADFTVR